MERQGALPEHVCVLIVGAGPTGLLCANLLGTYGTDALVVEQNATTSDLPKAIMLDDEGLRALQATGLASGVIDHVISGYGARYYSADGACFAEVDSPVTRQGYPRRNAFLQPDLEKIMASSLSRFNHVHLHFQTVLESFVQEASHVRCTLRLADGTSHILTCEFLLACDGAKSSVRKALGFEMEGATDARDWVVVDTVNDPDRDRFSKFFCDPARPMVSIPAPGGGRRYEYMIMPGEDANVMVAGGMIKEILSRFRHIPDQDILRAVVYTFHARVVEKLSSGRAALLGDAAHLTPPFAGQGMNAGLRDAFNVSWKVAHILKGKFDLEILDTYHRERKKPIAEMVDYAVALGEIVMPLGGLDEVGKQQIRSQLMGEASPVDKIEGASAMKPKPETFYRDGLMMQHKPKLENDLTGHSLPQFPVVSAMKEAQARLLDDHLGSGFALLAFGRTAGVALAQLPQDCLNAKRLALLCEEETPEELACESVFFAGNPFDICAQAGRIILVRPDRFIAAIWFEEIFKDIPSNIDLLCAY